MRKLFLFIAALTLSVGLWAINGVKYLAANGQERTANGVIEVTDASATLSAGWYVVKGTDVQTGGLVCNGDVHLILADGAKLTATGGTRKAGIQVSGEGNSLTIYAQSTGDQMGKLTATSGQQAAGIGGGYEGTGSNITINGGTVTATGGSYAAGIGGGFQGSGSNITINGGEVTANGGFSAAGIGSGEYGDGSYITITGGTVTANGGYMGAGIGGGDLGSGSNIFVATSLVVKADGNNPPTTEIATTRSDNTDIANDLAGKQYVTIEIDITSIKADAIAEINAAIDGVTDEAILAIATAAKAQIEQATTKAGVNSIKTQALADIAAAIFAKNKDAAITEITTAREGIQNENLNNWIDGAINDIQKGGPDATPGIDEIKEEILNVISFFKEGKAEGIEEGKAAGLAEAAAALPTDPEGTTGHAVVITKGDKSVTLINPESVSYIKQE